MRVSRLLLASAVVLMLAWILGPILWMITTSFATQRDLYLGNLFPDRPTLDNYGIIFGLVDVPGETAAAVRLIAGIRNGIVVGSSVTALNLMLGAPAAFALTRLALPGRSQLLGTFLLMRMIPPLAFIVPLFVLFRLSGLLDTIVGVILAQLAVTLPITIWFLAAYLRSVPIEFDRAARVDGCSDFQVFLRVVFPLMRPGLIGAGVVAFMTSWNDFLFVLILTSSTAAQTAQPIIASFSFPTTGPIYNLTMAGATLAAIPPVLLALVFQRQLVRGLTSGGLVG